MRGGDEKGVSFNGAVARLCVLMQGKYIYTYKIYIIPDSATKQGTNNKQMSL